MKTQTDYPHYWFWHILAIMGLGICIFVNVHSLNGPFIWDDYNFVVHNQTLRSFQNLPYLFKDNIAAGSYGSYNYYRPLLELSYMIDYHFWKLNVVGYHVTNIILHILVAIGVYFFCFQLSGNARVAFIAGMLFIIHPVHNGSVNAISGRGQVLSFLFLLAGLTAYCRDPAGKPFRSNLTIFLAFFFALLTKEISLIFPLLIAGYHFFYLKKPQFAKVLASIASLAAYLMIRIFYVTPSTSSPLQFDRFAERIPGIFDALYNYLRLLVLPIHLQFHYGQKLFTFTHLTVLVGVLLMILCLYYLIIYRHKKPVISFAIFWFLINLLPYSNLYLIYNYMAEHHLYVASLGYFLIIGILIDYCLSSFQKDKLIWLGFAIFVLYYSVTNILHHIYWSDPFIFYKRVLQFEPTNAQAYANLGLEYDRIGDQEHKIKNLMRACELDPGSAMHQTNLGTAFNQIGQHEQAIPYFQRAIQLKPDLVFGYNGLGIAYRETGEPLKAKAAFQKALRINPRYIDAYNNLAATFLDLKDFDAALAMTDKILALDPDHYLSYFHQGIAYYRLGQFGQAREQFTRVLALHPAHTSSHFYMAAIMKREGDEEGARFYLLEHFTDQDLYTRAIAKLESLDH